MTLDHIKEIISHAVEAAFGIKPEAFEVVYPEVEFGDYSANVAFKLAKTLRKSPRDIAVELAPKIKDRDIASAESAGAGYLNIRLTDKYWLDRLHEIKHDFARLGPEKPEKVQVEFLSANPTGPLTLGNARGGFVGDVLARVMRRAGHEVISEYYFNDGGGQIRKLVDSVKAVAGLDETAEIVYRGEYIEELARDYRDQLRELGDDGAGRLLTTAVFDKFIKDAIVKMNIKFDVWFNEKDLITSGAFDRAVSRLRSDGLVYEKDGAVWLKTTALGDVRDRVIRKSNGDVSYIGPDIPYHLNIFEERKFDRSIKVWGADHIGQMPSLKLTVGHLEPGKSLDFIIVQMIRLVKDGKEYKISKRAGTYVTVEELIDEVGVNVARFFFLMRSSDSQMDFDLDLAKEQSQKNPLHYLMYSYVRACSIMAQAKERGLKAGERLEAINSQERSLISLMMRLPELVLSISQDYDVHRLSFYGLDVAKRFHDYYEQERIIGLPKDIAQNKLFLIQRFIIFMEVYFEITGLSPVKKMVH